MIREGINNYIRVLDKLEATTKQRMPLYNDKGWYKRILYSTNRYISNVGEPKYIKQILPAIKREIDNNTVIVGSINTLTDIMERSTRQHISWATVVLNDTVDLKLNLIGKRYLQDTNIYLVWPA